MNGIIGGKCPDAFTSQSYLIEKHPYYGFWLPQPLVDSTEDSCIINVAAQATKYKPARFAQKCRFVRSDLPYSSTFYFSLYTKDKQFMIG